jgi:hypothetical protein
MSRQVLLALAALVIAAGSAYAQSPKFNVPFQFTIDKMVMPAGNYSIKSASDSDSMLIIQGLDKPVRSRFLFLFTNLLQSVGQTKLIFNCYGGSCFLSQVWTGSNVGRQLRESRQERQLAKQGPAAGVHALAAVRSVQ